MKRLLHSAFATVLVLALAACATPGPQPGEMEIRRGVVEQITPVQIQSNQHQGVGAVVGGLAGLGIGSLIGGGTGRDVAMITCLCTVTTRSWKSGSATRSRPAKR